MKLLDYLRSLFSCFVPRNIGGGAELVYGKRLSESSLPNFSSGIVAFTTTTAHTGNQFDYPAPDDGYVVAYCGRLGSFLGMRLRGQQDGWNTLIRAPKENGAVYCPVKKGQVLETHYTNDEGFAMTVRFFKI